MHVNERAANRTKPMRSPNLNIMAGNAAVIGNFIGGQITHFAGWTSSP
jgi:hypothetical protein